MSLPGFLTGRRSKTPSESEVKRSEITIEPGKSFTLNSDPIASITSEKTDVQLRNFLVAIDRNPGATLKTPVFGMELKELKILDAAGNLLATVETRKDYDWTLFPLFIHNSQTRKNLFYVVNNSPRNFDQLFLSYVLSIARNEKSGNSSEWFSEPYEAMLDRTNKIIDAAQTNEVIVNFPFPPVDFIDIDKYEAYSKGVARPTDEDDAIIRIEYRIVATITKEPRNCTLAIAQQIIHNNSPYRLMVN